MSKYEIKKEGKVGQGEDKYQQVNKRLCILSRGDHPGS